MIAPGNLGSFNSNTDFGNFNWYFEPRPLNDLLRWALQTFGDQVTQVTSFGPSGMVILDHLARLSPGIKILTIDPGFLFEESYQLWAEIERRYPISLEIRRPTLSPTAQALAYGPNLWERNPDYCCQLRKVLPLQDALYGLSAWLSGLRRDQSQTRADIPLISWDPSYHLVKINPLVNWTRGRVWQYILDNKVPYNSLHDRGYASIGCRHCTRPTVDGSDERAGRWAGYQKIECGIHLQLNQTIKTS